MPDAPPTPSPAGGSVSQTAGVALPITGAAVIAEYLVQPVWPPPNAVLMIVVGVLSPVVHLIGKAIYQKLQAVTGINDPSDDEPAPPQPPAVSPAMVPIVAPPVPPNGPRPA